MDIYITAKYVFIAKLRCNLFTQAVEIPATEETKKICCPDVTKGDGLFLKGRISQHDRVDNHSRDMDKLFFFIK